MKISNEIYIYPTDTVWGIGCSIYSKIGYEKIAVIKKVSDNKPLSIIFGSIEELLKCFQVPKEMNTEWLRSFFKLETTIGLPISNSLIEIPKWATANSAFVSLRCLETTNIKTIYQELQTPFFTTSLNISGEPPLVDFAAAEHFWKEHAPTAKFINLGSNQPLSGASSTIVFFKENLNYEIKREGKKIEEVKKYLMKLSGN